MCVGGRYGGYGGVRRGDGGVAVCGRTARGGDAGARGRRKGGAIRRGGARYGRREGSGLPGQEDLFQAGEDAHEASDDQGVQGGGQQCARPSAGLRRGGGEAELGELGGQGLGRRGLLVGHRANIN